MEENNNQDAKVENNTQQVDNNCKCGDNCKCGKKGAPLLLTILLCIVAGGLGAFLGNKVFNMTEKKTEEKTEEKANSNETSNSNEQKKEENSNELTEKVKNEMINKFATLLGEKEYKKGTVIEVQTIASNEVNGLMENKFNEQEKSLLILGAISGTDFTEKYKYVYGVEPKYVSIDCPAMEYDFTKKVYVEAEGGCGGVVFPTQKFYVDDVIKTSDTILSVQVYVGSQNSIVDDMEAGEIVYFSDYYIHDYLANNTVAKNAPVTKETTITEQNKTQFTKYNFNFEKSTDGNYYYKNVEKVK